MCDFNHVDDVYERVCNAIEEGKHSVCYVMGTGLGKSRVFMRLAKEVFPGKRILYIVPKRAIAEAIQNYDGFEDIRDRVKFNTFNVFSLQSKKTKSSVLKEFDVVFIDEAHHLGSKVYGVNLLAQMKELLPEGKYMFGLTATPIRSCDKIDVTSYFEETVYGLSTFDSINAGVLPPFEYYVCDTESFERVKGANYKEIIDYKSSEDLLADMLHDFERNKWLWFFSSIDELNKHKELVHKLLPKHTVVEIHSKSSTSIEDLKEDLPRLEKVVIMSVDKLLEGVHLDDFEGIILSRNVQSPTVLQQILGRVCSAGKMLSPVVIDCTKSAYKVFSKLVTESHMKSNRKFKGFTYDCYVNVSPYSVKKPILVYNKLASYKYFSISTLLACTAAGHFVYKNREYKSVQECCNCVGAKYSEVIRYVKCYEISPADAIDMYFERVLGKPFKYFGVTFNTLEIALNCFNVSFDELLKESVNLGVTLDIAMDFVRSNMWEGIYFRGDKHANIQACLKFYGIPEGKISYLTYWDFYQALDRYLSFKENAVFMYKGLTYNHLRDCCCVWGVSHKQVKRVIRKTGRPACEVLDSFIR